MRAPLSHEEIQELLGAYALDAVDDDERDVVDDHLTTCVRCRAEVSDHRETAALLAFSGEDAPTGVWDRIASTLDASPPRAPLELTRARPRARQGAAWRSWRPTGVAAAAAVVISVLALGVALRGGGDGSPSVPDGPRVVLTSGDGRHSADIVVASGRGFVVNDNLPALPEGQVYQLWGRRGDDVISLGLLGQDPETAEFVAGGEFDAYAITAERWPGVVSSQQQPVVAGVA